jgi:hypothetical protein
MDDVVDSDPFGSASDFSGYTFRRPAPPAAPTASLFDAREARLSSSSSLLLSSIGAAAPERRARRSSLTRVASGEAAPAPPGGGLFGMPTGTSAAVVGRGGGGVAAGAVAAAAAASTGGGGVAPTSSLLSALSRRSALHHSNDNVNIAYGGENWADDWDAHPLPVAIDTVHALHHQQQPQQRLEQQLQQQQLQQQLEQQQGRLQQELEATTWFGSAAAPIPMNVPTSAASVSPVSGFGGAMSTSTSVPAAAHHPLSLQNFFAGGAPSNAGAPVNGRFTFGGPPPPPAPHARSASPRALPLPAPKAAPSNEVKGKHYTCHASHDSTTLENNND